MIIYTTKSGDTLYRIAQMYGVTVGKLVEDNNISNPDRLTVGQDIIIDLDTYPHTITRGQTMWRIAQMYGIPLQILLDANPNIDYNNLQIGQVINIPTSVEPKTDIEVNGYAVANISDNVLNATLPYLTYLSIFSYQAREDGSLTNLYEQSLIDSARSSRVAPIMVVTNIGMSGGFDSDLAHEILTNDSIKQNLINNIINTLNNKNYYGVDIDFEYIYPDDKDAYVQFLQELKARLTPLGYTLSVALAPKYSGTQMGLLYEAHDYARIGQIVDRVIIMTYEWGYLYGPPLAIAPYNEVRRVISYATSVIPSEKILMGMPNYGYDWTLPYVQGTPATTITNDRAVQLAIDTGSVINFDRNSQSPYFNYTDTNGIKHVVWFDNARSVEARLELVNEFNLAGVSYWTINNFFGQGYKVLNNMFNIVKVL